MYDNALLPILYWRNDNGFNFKQNLISIGDGGTDKKSRMTE